MHGKKLCAVFEKLGFKNVASVISSGNVVFDTSSKNAVALERKIEKALPQYLGFTSTTIIRSRQELEGMVKKNPFKNKKHSNRSYLLVSFLKDKTLVSDGALYTTINLEQIRTPDIMSKLEKKYHKAITSRTWKTVERILKKMDTR
jgi:uncharacterized protein (DUF1697 family)